MRIYKAAPLIWIVPLLGGCLEHILSDLEPYLDTAVSSGSTTSTSTGEPPTPTTSAGSEIQTVTGPPGETTGAVEETTTDASPGTSTGAPVDNTPPTVVLSVEPDLLDEAGKTASLLLDATADVITVRLSMNSGEAVELTPADFPYTYEALSAKDNGMPHVFTVEVEDEEGLTAADDAELTVQLPASGAEKCLFEDNAVNGSMFSALVYTKTAIVGVGWRDKGTGPKAAIWKLDANHCEALPGWPKMIENWTEDGDPDLAAPASSLSAVAVDEHGHIAVGGNLIVNNKPQRYTALLTESGGRLWERTGAPGEVVSSVVIAPEDLVISGGWVFTSDNPPRTDARFWRHLPDKTVWKTDLAAPFTADEIEKDIFNVLSEKIRALLIEPETGFLVVVGEREFKPNDDVKVYTRAFIARYVPLGASVGSPSTSPGDAYLHDAVYSVDVCGGELIAGGWTRADDDPNAKPQALFRWVSNGVWSERLLEPLTSSELRGAACDREGKVIGAGVRSVGGSDAKVFAFTDPLGERTWYEKGAAGDDAANGVLCDGRGFCAWPGYRTINGKPVAIVRVHHP